MEIKGELKQEDFAVPASSTGLLETVIIVSSQDPDDEIHDKLGPEPENLGSSHKSPAKSPCRGANIGGSELAEEWKEGSFMVIDEAGEPPAPASTIGGHEEPVELMEEEQSRDHEEVAKPMEDEPDAKRRRINPPVLGEGESLGSVSEDLHLWRGGEGIGKWGKKERISDLKLWSCALWFLASMHVESPENMSLCTFCFVNSGRASAYIHPSCTLTY